MFIFSGSNTDDQKAESKTVPSGGGKGVLATFLVNAEETPTVTKNATDDKDAEIAYLRAELERYRSLPPTFDTCRKELANSVERNKQLAADMQASKGAEMGLTLIANEVLNHLGEDFEKRIGERDTENDILKRQLAAMNKALAEKEDLIMKLTTNLRVEQARHVADITNLMDAIEALKKTHALQLANLNDQLKRAIDENFAYHNQIHDLNDIIAKLTNELRDLTREHASCGPRNQSLLDEIERLKKQIGALTGERDDLRDQLAKARAQIAALQNELAANGQAQYAKSKSMESMDEMINALKQQLAERDAALRKAAADNDAALAAAQTQLNAMRAAAPPRDLIDNLRKQIADLQGDVAKALAGKDAAERKGGGASSRVVALETEMSTMQQAWDAEKAALGNKIDGLMGQINDLNGKIRDLQNQAAADRAKMQQELARQQQMAADEIALLKKELDDAKDALAKMKALKDAAEEDARNRLRQLLEEQAKNDALNSKLAALTKRYEDLRKDYDALADELRKAKSDLAAKDIEITTLQNELAKLRAKLADMELAQNNAASLRIQIGKLEDDLREAQKANDGLRDQIANLKDALAMATRNADAANAELAKLKQENADLAAKLNAALLEIERLQALIKELESAINDAKNKTVNRKETIPPHVQQKLDDLTRQLALMQELSKTIKDDMHPDNLLVEEVVTQEESSSSSSASSSVMNAAAPSQVSSSSAAKKPDGTSSFFW